MKTLASPVPTTSHPVDDRVADDRPRRSSALLRWLVWAPGVGIIISASVVTGGIVFFLLPLLGSFYAVFILIAWREPGAGWGDSTRE